VHAAISGRRASTPKGRNPLFVGDFTTKFELSMAFVS